jgi:hypothetical protein
MSEHGADVDRLLFDGETVEEDVPVGGDRLVVTSHRVLAFLPTRDGSNFEAVHRPNVTGVRRESGGSSDQLERGLKAAVLGFVLLVGGSIVSFDGLLDGASVDAAAASQTGIGDVLGLLDVLNTVLAFVDDALVFGAILSLAVAAVAFTLYWRSRRTDVVIRVAGGEDVRLGDDPAEAALTRVRRALELEA